MFEFRQGREIFSASAMGPLSLPFNGYRLSFAGPRRLGRDAVYPSPSRTEINNKWGYIYFPLYAFMPWTGTTFIASSKLKYWDRNFVAGKQMRPERAEPVSLFQNTLNTIAHIHEYLHT